MKPLHVNRSVADINASTFGADERARELEAGAGACCEAIAEHDDSQAAPGTGPGC